MITIICCLKYLLAVRVRDELLEVVVDSFVDPRKLFRRVRSYFETGSSIEDMNDLIGRSAVVQQIHGKPRS